MTYKEKLLDPRWQKKRLLILQRDSFCCTLCNDEKSTLHVHHKEYMRFIDPWEYEDDKLCTLCDECHYLLSEYEKDENGSIYTFKILKKITNTGYKFVFMYKNGCLDIHETGVGLLLRISPESLLDIYNFYISEPEKETPN